MVTGEEDGVVSVTGGAGGVRETLNDWSPSRASSSIMDMLKQSWSPFMLPVVNMTFISVGSGIVKSDPRAVEEHWHKSSHSSTLIKEYKERSVSGNRIGICKINAIDKSVLVVCQIRTDIHYFQFPTEKHSMH